MALASSLRLLGFTETEVARRLALFAVTRSAAVETAAWYHVPGRIEVLGKHTDYAGGRSLVCAIEKGFCVRTAARTDRVVRVTSADKRFTATLVIDKKTQLLLEARYPGPSGETIDRFSDYRDVGGVKVAHRRKSEGGGEKTDLTITKVEIDGTVPDTTFDRPAAP